MLHELIAGSLAANKIVDQGANIQQLKNANGTLVKDYNRLVEKYNTVSDKHNSLLGDNDSLRERIEEFYVKAREKSQREGDSTKTLLMQIDDLKKWQEEAEEVFKEKDTDADYSMAKYMLFLRIFEKLPEEMVMAAFAETFVHHPPGIIAQEFVLEHPEIVEQELEKHILGNSAESEKYQQIKKKALLKANGIEEISDAPEEACGGMRM